MSSKKILIIDDDVAVSTVVKIALDDTYDVATTTSALSAFKYLAKNRIDLILLDINMPEMNGMEALREIKNTHPEIIVIMFTAYASKIHMTVAKSLGAHGYINKPFDVNELQEYVDKSFITKSKQYFKQHN